MNIKVQPKIHNRFDIYKKNVVTGEEKQVGYAENIVLNQMWSRLCSGSTYFVNIHYGTGTGTLDPARTSLFTHLGTAVASDVEIVKEIPTSHWRRSITLGLTTANGAELTEVGIAYGSTASNLVTHAQIRDMNGNVISILKTDLDIITIYATVYITIDNSDPNIKFVHPVRNSIIDYLTGGSLGDMYYSVDTSNDAYDWAGWCNYSNIADKATTISADVANKKMLISTARYGVSEGNGHIGNVQIKNVARCTLPATGIYAGLELSGVAIDDGDGETDTFALPSHNIDESSLVVKVDGTPTSVSVIAHEGAYHTPEMAKTGSWSNAIMSPDGSLVIVDNGTWSYVYEFDNGVYVERYSTNSVTGINAISADNTYCIVGLSSSPWLRIYKINSDFSLTLQSAPTGIDISSAVRGVAISPDSSMIAVALKDSPFVKMFKRVAGVWEQMANVSGGYPTQRGEGIGFSADSSILVVIASNDFVAYTEVAGVWTKNTTLFDDYDPFGTTFGGICKFSSDGNYCFIASSDSSNILTMYKKVDGVYTKMTAPTVNGTLSGLALSDYSETDIYLAVAMGVSPYMQLFKKNGDSWDELTRINPDVAYPMSSCYINPQTNAIHINGGTSSLTRYYVYKVLDTREKSIEFATAPTVGSVITADYTVLGIHKTDQRVIDISGEIQFGEPTP